MESSGRNPLTNRDNFTLVDLIRIGYKCQTINYDVTLGTAVNHLKEPEPINKKALFCRLSNS